MFGGVAASIVLGLPLTLLAAACWARFAPLDEQARFVSALLLVVPGWIASICALSVVRRPAAVLALCVAASVALGFCLL
jgi:hypothetical protein